MVGSRSLTAAAGLLASLAVTAALWWYLDTLLVFLVLPFVPILFRGLGDSGPAVVQECSHCGFQATSDAYDYCPRDGSRLEQPEE